MNYTQYNSEKNPHRTLAMKQSQRDEIESHIAEFIANGGKIQVEEDAKDIAHNRAQGNVSII